MASVGKVFESSTLIFVHTQISLHHSVGLVEKSLQAKKQINPSTSFDRTPTCDRQTDSHRHRAIASTRASIASRG